MAAVMLTSLSFAAKALEINTASRAQLEQLRGLGVETTAHILEERARVPFSGWDDLGRRVKGVRGKRAQQLAGQGLTVDGQALPAPDDPAIRGSGAPVAAGSPGVPVP